MDIEEISKLVEFANSLVGQKTGNYLKEIEKEILQQVLAGKQLKHLQYGDYSNGYIQKFIVRDLWQVLSEATGKKVGKKNVQYILEKLWLEYLAAGSAEAVESEAAIADYPPLEDSYLAPIVKKFQSSFPNAVDTGNTSEFGTDNFSKFLQPGIALFFSAAIIACGFSLAWLANWYGVRNHLQGKLTAAQQGYSLAKKIYPGLAAVHYNQGVLDEDRGNYQQAHYEYQQAIKNGSIEAYNNDARLYILEGNYDQAISLLRVSLSMTKDEHLQSIMLKNRGWARLGQYRYDDAQADLEAAIKLNEQAAINYCFLAQVLEGKKNHSDALKQWKKYLSYSYKPQRPEEDNCLYQAQQRLTARGSKS